MTAMVLIPAGCMVFPDIESEPEEELFPPKIHEDQIFPENLNSITKLLPNCKVLNFGLGQVSDRNIDDVLYVLWFIDWERETYTDTLRQDRFIAPTNSVIRVGSALNFGLRMDYLLDESPYHTLMVWVGDRAPADQLDPRPYPGFPDTEEGQEGQFDAWTWTILIDDAGLCDELQD